MKRKLAWAALGAALFAAGYVTAQQKATHEVRRVVTHLDDSGKAVVLFDGKVPLSGERPPNFVANMWVTGTSLPDFSAEDRGQVKTGIMPPKNGTAFRIVGSDAPAKGLPPRHPMMHRTRTLDYAVIMSGEIDMLLDEGEVHLKAGDVLVQQATNHAWVNRGKEPCRVAFILMDSREP